MAPEHAGDVRALGKARPDSCNLAARQCARVVRTAVAGASGHAETDIDAPVAQRERPGVSRQQVRLEPHPHVASRSAVCPEVAAECMPVAPVAMGTDAERLANSGIDTVGGHDESGPHHAAVAEPNPGRARCHSRIIEAFEGDAEANVGLSTHRKVDKTCIEFGSSADACELPASRRQRQAHDTPARRANARSGHTHPRAHPFGQQAQRLELSQRERSEAVAAALVTPRRRAVDEHHLEPCTPGPHGGGCACRSGAHDQDINASHRLRTRPVRRSR